MRHKIRSAQLGMLIVGVIAATHCGCGGGNSNSNPMAINLPVPATVVDTVNAGNAIVAIAVDPSSNKIYVVNFGVTTSGVECTLQNTGNVTVIDGASDTTTTVHAGFEPVGVTVDPVNHTAYVVSRLNFDVRVGTCNQSSLITAIDSATLATSRTALPFLVETPTAIAANSVSRKAYVTARCCNSLIGVFDGATGSVGTLSDPSAVAPLAVAVNSATNKTYTVDSGNNTISVIDGATNSINTITDPNATTPVAAAVNETTNKIYVANSGSSNITIIDGGTNSVTTLSAGTTPVAVAVDAATNRIYVANSGANNVTVIDGASDSVSTISVGVSPVALAVEEKTNHIYVANAGNSQSGDPGSITVIDGNTNATTTLTDPKGVNPIAVAVNSATNKIYVANRGSNNVTVINGAHE